MPFKSELQEKVVELTSMYCLEMRLVKVRKVTFMD